MWKTDPDWASINLGILLCLECSGVHRGLGVHITKVRSATLDTKAWDPELLLVLFFKFPLFIIVIIIIILLLLL